MEKNLLKGYAVVGTLIKFHGRADPILLNQCLKGKRSAIKGFTPSQIVSYFAEQNVKVVEGKNQTIWVELRKYENVWEIFADRECIYTILENGDLHIGATTIRDRKYTKILRIKPA